MNEGVSNITLIICSLFIISFSITTCIDYNRLKKTLPPMFTLSDVNSMMIINGIMAFLAFVVFIIGIYNIVNMKMYETISVYN